MGTEMARDMRTKVTQSWGMAWHGGRVGTEDRGIGEGGRGLW